MIIGPSTSSRPLMNILAYFYASSFYFFFLLQTLNARARKFNEFLFKLEAFEWGWNYLDSHNEARLMRWMSNSQVEEFFMKKNYNLNRLRSEIVSRLEANGWRDETKLNLFSRAQIKRESGELSNVSGFNEDGKLVHSQTFILRPESGSLDQNIKKIH